MEEVFYLYDYENKLIFQDNKSVYALDKTTLQETVAKIDETQSKIPFLFILGLYKFESQNKEIYYFLVLVTKIQKSDFFNISQIKSYEIISLSNIQKIKEAKHFRDLLELGLNHCPMYFSDNYNLTLTFQQQFQHKNSRTFFIWNYEAINCLKEVWPNVKIFKEVIAGFYQKVDPFVIISRKCNRNGGCHSWNRGADISGYVANFVENEEILILSKSEDGIEKMSAISHIEIGGSCPFLWSQYPTMTISIPIRIGPPVECERRFNLHFDLLDKYYIDKKKKKKEKQNKKHEDKKHNINKEDENDKHKEDENDKHKEDENDKHKEDENDKHKEDENDKHKEDKNDKHKEDENDKHKEDENDKHKEDENDKHKEDENDKHKEDENDKHKEDENDKHKEDENDKHKEDENDKHKEDENGKHKEDENDKHKEDENDKHKEDENGKHKEDENDKHKEDENDKHKEDENDKHKEDENGKHKEDENDKHKEDENGKHKEDENDDKSIHKKDKKEEDGDEKHKKKDDDKKNHSEKSPIIIVSLLNNHGKELVLNNVYKELADKREIRFFHIKFNRLVRKEGKLTEKIGKIGRHFDASIIKEGKIIQKQKRFARVNCSCCLDRTSVFMEILTQKVFEKYEPSLFEKNIENHKKLWILRADEISREYALTRGMKTYLIENDFKTTRGKYYDDSILLKRFFYGIFYEGKYTDAYNAVLQEKKFTCFDDYNILQIIFLFLQLVLVFVYLVLFKGKDIALKTWNQKIKTIINHPHIPEIRDADEFNDNDFIDLRINN
ncbi:hypothetical protein M9Y10_042416 [Tritrichomonas musculus]|uniref:SAC domain-containing protein n=1 Tax=Tritrichomonas musculus TaxID=1915356 RepID=A0ABR2GQ71_9EUKA